MPPRPGAPTPTPPSLPTVHLAHDHLRQDVAARLRAREWHRVGRGAYVSTTVATDVRDAALARIVGVHHRLRGQHAFSHASAAMLWGLPLWSVPAQVHVYQSCRPGTGQAGDVRRHLGPIDAAAVTTLAGLPVTTLPRTAVDCARDMRPLPGLVVMDAAVRAGARLEDLLALIHLDPTGRGMRRALELATLADGGAESPQESALRFVLLRAGLPQPDTQVRVDSRLGTFWGDLGWERWRTLLEYDGRSKYTGREALIEEKRRHDAIVEAGWRILRVTKEDLRAPSALLTRVSRLLPADIQLTRRPYLRTG